MATSYQLNPSDASQYPMLKGLQSRWCRNISSGFTLTEVLVALLMLGLSVLGYANLQIRGLAMTQDIFWRTQAFDIAQQLATLVRAHPSQAHFFLQVADWQMPTTALPLTCVGRNVCSTEKKLQADIDQLKSRAIRQIPQSNIQVATCGTSQQLCAKIAWKGSSLTHCDNTSEACISLPLAITAI